MPLPSVEAAVLQGICLVQVGSWHIEILELNGRRREHVVHKRPYVATTERISPDGSYIVATSLESAAGISRDGQILWQVPGARAVRPAISPDGRKVTLLPRGDTKLAIYDATSNQLTSIGVPGHHPVWSPSGDRLAYDDGQNVRVYDLTASTTIDAGPGTEPSWLPDGTSVAVRMKSKVEVIHLATGARSVLFEDARGLSVPRWSPDGEFMLYKKRGGRYWWSIDWTGSEPTQVVLRDTRTGSEAFIAAIAKANPGDYMWVTNPELCRCAE
jgi:Tol biopolymer transport system component